MTNTRAENAAVLWTGGKDCALAFHEVVRAGNKVARLVTFAPAGSSFLAHPVGFMKYQAEAIGLPHQVVAIKEPFREGYERAISDLRSDGVDALITGDLAEVDGYPNWIRECSKASGMNVLTPLWGGERIGLLNRLLGEGFRIILSCVKEPWFDEEWLGRELTGGMIGEWTALSAEKGFDACGEQGEFHTLVLDGPVFRRSLRIDSATKHRQDTLMYLDIQSVSLVDK